MAAEESIDTIVIGGGQSGLSMSYHLANAGIDHVVLERYRIGERWRSERWDSLRFQFPNRYVRLPGFDYRGDEPEAFSDAPGIVDVIERYARHIDAPVRSGINVSSVQRIGDAFSVQTNSFPYRANNVIVAAGPYQKTLIPPIARALPAAVAQLTASSYTNPDALPDGAVLVVGAGGSGVQIAEDLMTAGREVVLSVSNHRRTPRRYRGRDVMDWFEELGFTHQPVDARPRGENAPLLTGVNGGYEVDLRRLVAGGATLVGRLEGVDGTRLEFGDRLLADMAEAEGAYRESVERLEAVLVERKLVDGPAPPPPEPPGPMPDEPPLAMDIADADIGSVIWATGYGVDFSWIHCGEYDDEGYPVQSKGVSTVQGLYFLGLYFLTSARSSFFWGVGDDAASIVSHMTSTP